MSSRIKQIYTDILLILEDMDWKYKNIYDNQTDEMIIGSSYSFLTPAVFIEFDLGQAVQGNGGFTFYPDTLLSFHIVDTLLNDGDNMEQNLGIFDLRDSIKKKFTGSKVSFCSAMMCVSDKKDFKHNNVYKYIVSFKTQFIDNSGSDIDKGEQWLILTSPTLGLTVVWSWVSGKQYEIGNRVGVEGIGYSCIEANNDKVFDPSKWELI